jgi:hypothetical protein
LEMLFQPLPPLLPVDLLQILEQSLLNHAKPQHAVVAKLATQLTSTK